ncbi:MAG: hypothetical protein CL933_02305 [Deltaproteobacteria bacterium]|nr:hypothetical protein [Deltaproteobacteria bacterium]
MTSALLSSQPIASLVRIGAGVDGGASVPVSERGVKTKKPDAPRRIGLFGFEEGARAGAGC